MKEHPVTFDGVDVVAGRMIANSATAAANVTPTTMVDSAPRGSTPVRDRSRPGDHDAGGDRPVADRRAAGSGFGTSRAGP